MAGKEEWMENTETWKLNAKAMDTNTGQSPGPRASANSLETHKISDQRTKTTNTLGNYYCYCHCHQRQHYCTTTTSDSEVLIGSRIEDVLE